MKKTNLPQTAALTFLLLASTNIATAQTTKQWSAGGTTLNWSDPANWSDSAAPGTGDILYFEDLFYTGYTNVAKAVNNVVSADTAVGAINYTATATGTAGVPATHFYTTLIPGGVTLTLGGSSSTALVVGDVPGSLGWLSSGTFTNYSTITGAGTLAVNDPVNSISVGWRNRATLDLTGLNTFTANLGQVLVGASVDNPNTTGPTGWLLLAKTNTITTAPNLTAPGVLLGYATNTTGAAVLALGGVNSFNTDGLVVGGRRSSSTLMAFGNAFSNTAPASTFKLRSSAGGTAPIPVFAIGDLSAAPNAYATTTNSSSVSATATADFTGGMVDILADSIFIGRSSRPEIAVTGGTGTGTLIVEQGTVTATNIYIAYKQPGATNATIGAGTLILKSNAVVNVVKDLFLTYRTNGTAFINQPVLMVSNSAVLNIGGNLNSIHTIGSWTPAAVALGGGTINMTGGGVVNVPTLQGFGSLTNANSITVTNALSVNTDTTIGTLNLGKNLALGSAVKLTFNLGTNNTVGGGVNDYISVANNISFTNNPIITIFSAPLVAGTYSLIGYGGTQSGSVFWTNTTRSPIGLVQSGGQVALVVTNYTPAALTWRATGTSANWDSTTLAWNSNTEKFYAMDNVVFDDTGIATNVVVSGTVTPSSMTFNNSTKTYTLSSGVLGGYSDFTKNGTGRVILSMTGNNTFTGPVNLNAGTVVMGAFNTGMLGDATGVTPINIASGATLELFNGVGSSSSFGRPVNVAGTGVGGIGAIVVTAANSPTLATRNLTLTGDTTFGCTNTAANPSIAGFAAPYTYALDLAGYTLTTAGVGPIRLNQYTITNSGSIVVGGSYLGLNSCIVDGPGTISLGSKFLNFYTSFTTGYVAKAISSVNGAISATTASAVPIPLLSPIAIASGGSISFTNSQTINASGVISGNGALIKYGNSNLVLTAANTYSGATLVAGGKLSLSGAGTLASPSITVNGGATFDVTGKSGGYTPPSGQTIQVDGTAAGDFNVAAGSTLRGGGAVTGLVTVASGGTLAVGAPSLGGALVVATNLVFNGGTNVFKFGGPDDLVVVGGNLTFTAPVVISISPVGPLTGRHVLYQYAGTISGVTTNNLIFSSPRPLIFGLDTNTVGEVAINISGSVTLDWAGGNPSAPTAWDVNTTPNWLNSGTPDIFFPGDSVVFGDSAATNVVRLAAAMQPAGVTMNNSSPYTFTGVGGITAGSFTLNGGSSLTLSNSGNVTLTGSGLALNAGTLNFSQPTNTTLTGKISGFAQLAKGGTNTLTVLSSDSTNFNGTVSLNAGTLRPASANALGAATITVAGGATLDVNGQVGNLSQISVVGAGVDGLGAINNRGVQQTNAVNTLTLNDNTTLGAASNRWDVVGTLTGNGYNLTKAGASDIWIRSGADTGLGQIDIKQGQLVFANIGTDLGDASKSITVRTNASLAFAYDIKAEAKPTTVQAGGDIRAYANTSVFPTIGQSNLFAGDITFSSTGMVRVAGNAGLNLSGSLSGPGLVNGDAGSLTLSGSNVYSGDLTVNYGSVTIASSLALPTNTTVTVDCITANSGVWLYLAGDIITPTNVPANMIAYRLATGAKTPHLSGQGTWAGPINITGIQSGSTTLPQVYFEGVTNLVVTGPVVQTGTPVDVQINGFPGTVDFKSPLQFNGTMRMGSQGLGIDPILTQWYTTMRLDSSNNSFTNMLLWRGKVIIGADNAIPLACPITTSAIRTDNDARGWFDLDGHVQTFANFPGLASQLGGAAMPVWFGNDSTNKDATIVFTSTITNTWLCWIVDNYDINSVSPHKTGLSVTSGYLRLGPWSWPAGAWFDSSSIIAATNNVYTGPTLVSGGTLQVDNALGNTPVTVSGSGKLAGIGPFGGPVTVNSGATLSPGGTATYTSAIGTMAVSNNVTLGGTCLMEINLTAGTCDQVVGINNLTYGGTLVVTNVGAQAVTNGTIVKLFDAASYTAGTVAVQPASPALGLRWDTSFLAVDGTLHVAPVNTSVTSINATVSGNSLNLAWPEDHTGWRLLGQTNSASTGLTPAWFEVAGSSATNNISMPLNPGNPSVFFRLVYP